MSRLARQLAEVKAALQESRTPFALIGGMALASHGVVRGTRDVDFLVAAEAGDAVDALLKVLGYDNIHRGADSATYTRRDEGLIAFKLQAVVNDPQRTQDLEDIRALLRANRDARDMAEVREYFRLFDRESQLDELLRQVR